MNQEKINKISKYAIIAYLVTRLVDFYGNGFDKVNTFSIVVLSLLFLYLIYLYVIESKKKKA